MRTISKMQKYLSLNYYFYKFHLPWLTNEVLQVKVTIKYAFPIHYGVYKKNYKMKCK